jgi:uncharacterized glyoxalase superfamily protein PhnB
LGVADVIRSLLFYREGLGFPVHNDHEGDEAVFFALEGSWLSIYPREKLAEDAEVSAEGSGFSGITLAHNVGSRQEVDAVFDQAIRAGARPVKIPQDVFWGGYSGYFSDPDGHLWEIAWNPFTNLT